MTQPTRVFITGAAGFVGGFLASHAADGGASVLGIGLNRPERPFPGEFEVCDVRDRAKVGRLMQEFRPLRIFHLAAQSFPTVSMERPYETLEINAGGTINVFEAARKLDAVPCIVVACSSAEYGPVEAKDLPVREVQPLRPVHPYGVSKVAQDLLAYQYWANYKIPTVRIRIFNTTGPGKENDVCSDLCRRAVEIELGLREPRLPVGNLKARRAIADARDLVRGLWVAPEKCEMGDVYNVGGDGIYSVEEIIAAIRAKARRDFAVAPDPQLFRPTDEPVIAGNTEKFRSCTGWRPEIPLDRTLDDTLAWWRERLARPAGAAAGAR